MHSLFLLTERLQRKSQFAEHLPQVQTSGDFKLSHLETIFSSFITVMRNLLLLCQLVLSVKICRVTKRLTP